MGRFQRVLTVSSRTMTAGLTMLFAQSVLWHAAAPVSMKGAVVAIGVCAWWRPSLGLLLVAVLAPLGHVIGVQWLDAYPARGTEAFTLAFLAGWLLRNLQTGATPSRGLGSLRLPVLALAWIVIASGLVQLGVLQVWQDRLLPFAWRTIQFVAVHYHDRPGDFRPWAETGDMGFVITAVQWLQGLALFTAAIAFCRQDPSYARRLTGAVVVGAAGAASMSLASTSLAVTALELDVGDVEDGIMRVSGFIDKVNMAGSFFAMTTLLAAGAALSARREERARWRWLWWVGAGLMAVSLLLTQSRFALVGGLFSLLSAGLVILYGRNLSRPLRRLIVVASSAVALGLLLTLLLDPFGVRRVASSLQAMEFRAWFTETSLRMWGTAIWFGVGIDQYYLHAWRGVFSPPELKAIYVSGFHAHNSFLHVAAELGVVGLVALLGLLGLAGRRLFLGFRAGPRADSWLLGVAAGLIAFLISALGGHPLLLPEVAFPFWIILGLGVGLGDSRRVRGRTEAVTGVPERAGHVEDAASTTLGPFGWNPSRAGRVATIILGLALAASVPWRLRAATRDIDLRLVSYGFYRFETDAEGRPYRWVGPHGTFFVPASVRFISLPVRADLSESPEGVRLELSVNGSLISAADMVDGEWHTFRLDGPISADRFWQVDIRAWPTWIPAAVRPGSTDTRELGVKVGIPPELVDMDTSDNP